MQFSAFPVIRPVYRQPEADLGQMCWLVSCWLPVVRSGAPESFPTCCVALGKPSPFLACCPGDEEPWALSLFLD